MVKTIFDYSLVHRLFKKYILQFTDVNPEDIVLDAGCGIGIITDELAKITKNAIGADINHESIAYARDHMKGSYVQTDLENTKFDECQFNKIVCSNVLEHIKDPNNLLSEFRRILKLEGELILLVPCLNGILMGTKYNKLGHEDVEGGEYHYRDGFYFKELEAMLRHVGFKVVRKRYINFFFPEVITELSKYYSFKVKKIRYQGQSDASEINNSKAYYFYQITFPFLYGYTLFEELIFPKLFKGHSMILKAIKVK